MVEISAEIGPPLGDLPIDIVHALVAACPAHECHQPLFEMPISTRPLLIVTEQVNLDVFLDGEVLGIKH